MENKKTEEMKEEMLSEDEKKASPTNKNGKKKKKKIGELENLLKEQEKDARENYDQMLRARAELENFKKRTAKEKADLITYGNANLIREILPVFDNLKRATDHPESTNKLEGLLEGIKMTIQQFYSVLEQFGVEEISAMEQKFDPHVHEAVMQMESEDHEENMVVSELEKGYLLKGKLLRPAKVAVAKSSKKSDD